MPSSLNNAKHTISGYRGGPYVSVNRVPIIMTLWSMATPTERSVLDESRFVEAEC